MRKELVSKNDIINKEFGYLQELLVRNDKGIIKTSDNFVTKDIVYVNTILENITALFFGISKLTDRGFINDSNIDVSYLDLFIKKYCPLKSRRNKELVGGYTIFLNTLFFNFLLLILLNIAMRVEKHCELNYDERILDTKTDLKTLRKKILSMIHPVIRNKITNKGISIVLNTVVGYDAEFQTISSLKMINELLSIQLAGRTDIVLKVPIIDRESLKPVDLPGTFDSNEKEVVDYCLECINNIIKDIRSFLYQDNDLLIDKIHNKLDYMKHKSDLSDCFHKYRINYDILRKAIEELGFTRLDTSKVRKKINDIYENINLIDIILNEIEIVKISSEYLEGYKAFKLP